MHQQKEWLNRLDQIIQEYAKDQGLNNHILARKVTLSERHMIRRVKQLTGLSPQKYIRQHRLRQAMNYLNNGTYRTVKETATAIGYTNISYFIQQFEKEYGRKPLRVLRDAGWR